MGDGCQHWLAGLLTNNSPATSPSHVYPPPHNQTLAFPTPPPPLFLNVPPKPLLFLLLPLPSGLLGLSCPVRPRSVSSRLRAPPQGQSQLHQLLLHQLPVSVRSPGPPPRSGHLPQAHRLVPAACELVRVMLGVVPVCGQQFHGQFQYSIRLRLSNLLDLRGLHEHQHPIPIRWFGESIRSK